MLAPFDAHSAALPALHSSPRSKSTRRASRRWVLGKGRRLWLRRLTPAPPSLQEMFAFSVTPGLANRTFGAAARLAYLRFGVLLIGARVPIGAGGVAVPPDPLAEAAGIPGIAGGGVSGGALGGPDLGNDQAYNVLLFPCELRLTSGESEEGRGGKGRGAVPDAS